MVSLTLMSATMTPTLSHALNPMDRAVILALKRECRDNPARFNRRVLGRPAYWWRQAEVAESVCRTRETLVPAGNAVGKSFVAAGLLHWFLQHHHGGMVLATAPTQTQLEEVLWKEVERAYINSRTPLGGRMLRAPLKIDLGDGWEALAYSTVKTERLSGHHRGDMLVIVDEASGVPGEIREALDSCNPSRELNIGNPLRPDGWFYERCQRAMGSDSPDVNLITIPSLESPDIHLERSPRGLADAGWLRKSRNDYGEGSLWWLSHVLARFPDSAADSLIPRDWIDRAASVSHVEAGHRRMSIDIAEGNDGDPSGWLVRDDGGVIAFATAKTWSLEDLANHAKVAATRYRVEPRRITYDAGGPGADFGARLDSVGLSGALRYKGGTSGGEGFSNLRTACHWLVRQRLDPLRTIKQGKAHVPQPAFHLPPDFVQAARRELQALKYEQLSDRKVTLEDKARLRKALGHSPTLADLLAMSFAYPAA